jgi:hypothetical protein
MDVDRRGVLGAAEFCIAATATKSLSVRDLFQKILDHMGDSHAPRNLWGPDRVGGGVDHRGGGGRYG